MVKITQSTKPIKEEAITRNWHLIDVSDKILGRIAPEIAKLLQGKHKKTYVPYLDAGDNVVVVNAKKVVVTGKKAQTKQYTKYSGYPGGLKAMSFERMMEKKPAEVIRHAVLGMLPKNKLRDRRIARLHVYPNEKHPFIKELAVKK
jgi:large subunit ribosomal protein L13